jgi:hypothetical protein
MLCMSAINIVGIFRIRCVGRYLCVQLSCWIIEPQYRCRLGCSVFVGRRLLELRMLSVWPLVCVVMYLHNTRKSLIKLISFCLFFTGVCGDVLT